MLSPLIFTFQRADSQVLKEDILGHTADKKPIWLSKGFIHLRKEIVLTLASFSKVYILRKGKGRDSLSLFFSKGRIKNPRLMYIYPYNIKICIF